MVEGLAPPTDKLRSDNSLFQIVLIERGFVMQSIILLYIKETDGRPADGAIQSRIGWEEIEDAHGTPYDKIWFLMSEMNRGPGYHIYHRTCLHLKKTKKVGQMDDFRIQN